MALSPIDRVNNPLFQPLLAERYYKKNVYWESTDRKSPPSLLVQVVHQIIVRTLFNRLYFVCYLRYTTFYKKEFITIFELNEALCIFNNATKNPKKTTQTALVQAWENRSLYLLGIENFNITIQELCAAGRCLSQHLTLKKANSLFNEKALAEKHQIIVQTINTLPTTLCDKNHPDAFDYALNVNAFFEGIFAFFESQKNIANGKKERIELGLFLCQRIVFQYRDKLDAIALRKVAHIDYREKRLEDTTISSDTINQFKHDIDELRKELYAIFDFLNPTDRETLWLSALAEDRRSSKDSLPKQSTIIDAPKPLPSEQGIVSLPMTTIPTGAPSVFENMISGFGDDYMLMLKNGTPKDTAKNTCIQQICSTLSIHPSALPENTLTALSDALDMADLIPKE